jgi:hypothetical protein
MSPRFREIVAAFFALSKESARPMASMIQIMHQNPPKRQRRTTVIAIQKKRPDPVTGFPREMHAKKRPHIRPLFGDVIINLSGFDEKRVSS